MTECTINEWWYQKYNISSYEDVQELEDAFMGEYVEDVPWFWIDDG